MDELWKEFKEKAKIYSPFFTFSNEHDYRVYLKKVNEDYKVINYNEHYEVLIDFSNNDSDLIIVSDKCNNFDNKLYVSSTNDLYVYSVNKRKFGLFKTENGYEYNNGYAFINQKNVCYSGVITITIVDTQKQIKLGSCYPIDVNKTPTIYINVLEDKDGNIYTTSDQIEKIKEYYYI